MKKLAYSNIVFGNPKSVDYGCFFCVPEGKKYVVKSYFCSEAEAPASVWDVLDKVVVTYGCFIPAASGWIWENSEDRKFLGPDPEILSRKKTIKAAFAYWLSDLLANHPRVRIKDLQEN